uniref:Dihydrolipoamide acetyltransferase component of pyruvate dehydrogenase complex n=1 Tax=candidate division WOR-3 bacterium TaxID=2052148 RepID=A0A7V3KPD2_UNCW3
MAFEVQMPNIGISIAEGTIEKWLKKEGERVEKGESLVVIMTDKVTIEIPAEVSGILLKIFSPPGSKVRVGETIALIGSPEESQEALSEKREAKLPSTIEVSASQKIKDLRISPLARRIAAEYGLDMNEVTRKYPGQKIGKEEILSFVTQKKDQEKVLEEVVKEGIKDKEEIKPLSGTLRAMAEHMALSVRTAARVTTMAEVDMTELEKLRNALKENFQKEYGTPLTFLPFVIKAMAEGIKIYPILNASLRNQEIVLHRAVNVGIAVDTGESLLVPVVKNVESKNILELSREINHLVTKAREGKLTLEDIKGGTISLTNAGVYGALLATPIIHQPQSAILWMGKVMETPVVREGKIVIRSMMYLCLSYDHRLIRGAQAVQFLQVVKKKLEDPYLLLF